MSSKHVAECVNRSLRDVCSSGMPFGGKVVVFGGDPSDTISNKAWV